MKQKIIALGNQELADTGRQPANVICAANADTRFSAATFSEPLTAYAVGWDGAQQIQQLLAALFPVVKVPRRFEFKSADNAREFLSEADDVRGIGAAFKRLEFTGASVNQKTLNKGLTVRLDRDEILPGGEEDAVSRLITRLYRNELRRGIALIVAAATNTGKTWNTSADPDADVMADLLLGADSRGMGSDLVVFGATAWQKRFQAFRAQNNAGAYASSSMTPQQLASLLGVREVLISNERYLRAPTNFWTTNAVVRIGVTNNGPLIVKASNSVVLTIIDEIGNPPWNLTVFDGDMAWPGNFAADALSGRHSGDAYGLTNLPPSALSGNIATNRITNALQALSGIQITTNLTGFVIQSQQQARITNITYDWSPEGIPTNFVWQFATSTVITNLSFTVSTNMIRGLNL